MKLKKVISPFPVPEGKNEILRHKVWTDACFMQSVCRAVDALAKVAQTAMQPEISWTISQICLRFLLLLRCPKLSFFTKAW